MAQTQSIIMDTISTILALYGFPKDVPVSLLRESSDNVIYLVEVSDKKIIRIGKKLNEGDVRFEREVVAHLRLRGVPVPVWQQAIDGAYWQILPDGRVAVVFNFIEGMHVRADKEHLPSHSQAANAGRMLADIHAAGREFRTSISRGRTIFSELERVKNYEELLAKDFAGGQEFVNQVGEMLAFARQDQTVSGLIHNDFRPHNVFFDDRGDISGVLDFDWCTIGPIDKDVAHAVLEWSFPDGCAEPDQGIFDAFLNAYNTRSEVRCEKTTRLYKWIMYAALSDVATYFCDRIHDPNIQKRIGSSYMYKKYLHFKNLLSA